MPGDDPTLREFIEEKFRASERALDLKSAELERRLGELNQLRKEVVSDRERFMLRDVWDEGHRSLEAKVEGVITRADERRETYRVEMQRQFADHQRQVDDLKRRMAIMTGAALVVIPLAGVIGAAVAKAFGI